MNEQPALLRHGGSARLRRLERTHRGWDHRWSTADAPRARDVRLGRAVTVADGATGRGERDSPGTPGKRLAEYTTNGAVNVWASTGDTLVCTRGEPVEPVSNGLQQTRNRTARREAIHQYRRDMIRRISAPKGLLCSRADVHETQPQPECSCARRGIGVLVQSHFLSAPAAPRRLMDPQ